MCRVRVDALVLLVGAAVLCLPFLGGGTEILFPMPNEAGQLHDDAIVVDGHNDLLTFLVPPHDRFPWENGWEGDFLPVLNMNRDLSTVTRYGHIDLPTLRAGNLNVPYFAVFSSRRFWGERALEQALAQIWALHYNVRENPEEMDLARTPGEMRAAVRAGRIAAVLTVEGADYLTEARGEELLRQLVDLGVAVIGPTWNDSNALAEGLNSTYADGQPSRPGMGLTTFGAEMVRRMNELGVLIDVSHLHENSFWDVLEISDAPVIASHSAAAAVRDHPRNLTDRQIEALAAGGGVVHVAFVRDFLTPRSDEASVRDVVDHIDHIAQLVGVRHVALGSDFDGAPMPLDLPDASHMPRITAELQRRGYTPDEVRMILGENALRVLGEAQRRRVDDDLHEVHIHPGFTMGERLPADADLRAAVHVPTGLGLSPAHLRVIVNGRKVPHQREVHRYGLLPDAWGVTVSVCGKDLSNRGFHVVTWEISDGRRTRRETRIVHLDGR